MKYPDGRSTALEDAPRFTKLSYGFTRLQDVVTGRLLAYLSLRGQAVADNLDTTEQFRLGGADGVRAFPSGEGTGDIGTVASVELRLLPPEAWFGRAAREMVFSVFVDGGSVQYRYRPRAGATPVATSNTATFSGAGLGVTWVRAGAYALRLGAAKPISGTSRSGDQSRDVRFYLQASKFFN